MRANYMLCLSIMAVFSLKTTTSSSEEKRAWKYGPVDPSEYCQQHLGSCFYHPTKYAETCQKLHCTSLHVMIDRDIELRPYIWILNFQTYWKPINVIIDVPYNVPIACETDTDHGIGVCNQHGKCEPMEYALALNYSLLKPIDGKYTIAKNHQGNCTILGADIREKYKALTSQKCTGTNENCVPYSVDILSCQGPPPSLGGAPCWGRAQEPREPFQSYWQLPLKVHRCNQCSFESNFKDMECDPSWSSRCYWESVSVYDIKNWERSDDYEPCCLNHTQARFEGKVHNGKSVCISGQCLPYI